jgi:hypothetical protein
MKKALISPNELVQQGYRVAEVCAAAFEVAEPLFWIDCADDVAADQFWFDPVNQTIVGIPQPPIGAQPVTTGSQTL